MTLRTTYSTTLFAAIFALLVVPAGASNVSESVRQACKSDYQRYCKAYKVGTEGLRACMSRSIRRVSNVCISALVRNGDMTQAQADKVKQEKGQSAKRPTHKRSVRSKSSSHKSSTHRSRSHRSSSHKRR
jgi:hypothetical protein